MRTDTFIQQSAHSPPPPPPPPSSPPRLPSQPTIDDSVPGTIAVRRSARDRQPREMFQAQLHDPNETSIEASDWIVVSGENTLLQGNDNKQVVGVRKLILHSEGKFNRTNIEEDIAILVLDQPIKFDGMHRSSICLPDINQTIAANQMAYISGWGHTEHNGNVSTQLQHAQVPIVSTEICNQAVIYLNTIPGDKILCAGYKEGGIDACQFDSGGSLDYKVKDRWYAIGIVSSGWECARPNAYGLYTRVTNYMDWIISTILFEADK